MAINPKLLEAAIVAHEAYLAGENYERRSPLAHTIYILEMLHLDQAAAFEGAQGRVQCGLEPIDVIAEALAGTLTERMAASRIEVAEQIERNNNAPKPPAKGLQDGPVERHGTTRGAF